MHVYIATRVVLLHALLQSFIGCDLDKTSTLHAPKYGTEAIHIRTYMISNSLLNALKYVV